MTTFKLRHRRGISPVIATVILAAAVIVIGGITWSYALSATTIMANDYVNGTLSTLYDISERFTIEHLYYNDTAKNLVVYLYNYGEVPITVDTYVTPSSGVRVSALNAYVPSKHLAKVIIPIDVSSGTNLSIKCHTRRSNDVYDQYYVS